MFKSISIFSKFLYNHINIKSYLYFIQKIKPLLKRIILSTKNSTNKKLLFIILIREHQHLKKPIQLKHLQMK